MAFYKIGFFNNVLGEFEILSQAKYIVKQSIKFQIKNITIDLTLSYMTNEKLNVMSKEIIRIIFCCFFS